MKTLIAILLLIPSLSWGEKIKFYLDCKEKMLIPYKNGDDHFLFAYDININTSKPKKSSMYNYSYSPMGDFEDKLTFVDNDRVNFIFKSVNYQGRGLKLDEDYYMQYSVNIKTFQVSTRMMSVSNKILSPSKKDNCKRI